MVDTGTRGEIDDPVISIGVLAQKVGLSVSAVRKYENEGLIIVYRTASGHRLFSREDIDRVRNIQHMIQDLGLNVAGIRRIQALLPCWDLLPCQPETRNSCPACKDNTRPCWTIRGLDVAPRGNECRRCPVYRFGSLCTEDIKHLLYEQDDFRNAGPGIQELLQRLRKFKAVGTSNKEK